MADLVHNFGVQKRKRGTSFKRATDGAPEVVGEADQHPIGESSDVQAIVVLDSLETGFHGRSALVTTLLVDLGEVSLTHAEVQEDTPSEQVVIQPYKVTSTRTGHSR